jgi:excisionase family DNA binding protein
MQKILQGGGVGLERHPMAERSYRLREVAEELSVARETVLRLLHRGDLKGYKVGRDWRVKETELRRFQEQRAEIRHPRPSDPLAEVNGAIVEDEGICTRDAEKDQAHRDNEARPFRPPLPYE